MIPLAVSIPSALVWVGQQRLFQPEAEEVKINKAQPLPHKWGTAYKLNRKNCHKTSDWKRPLFCTFYSNQPGCCTAWSSALHFVCYCAHNHPVSMFHPLYAEVCSLILFCHQTGSNLAMTAPNGEAVNGKERPPHSWIYSLAENKSKSTLN